MSERITVHWEQKPIYDIVIEDSFDELSSEISKLSVENKRICIVTESTVGPLYADEVKNIVAKIAKEVYVFTFEAGEQNKNLDVVR